METAIAQNVPKNCIKLGQNLSPHGILLCGDFAIFLVEGGNPMSNYNPWQMQQSQYQRPMYGGQYTPYQQVPQPALQPTTLLKVNGMNGANMYQMAPNSQVLLLDEAEPILYLAVTDSAGYKSITVYDITPHKDQQTAAMDTFEARLRRLEEDIYGKPDSGSTGKNGNGDSTK